MPKKWGKQLMKSNRELLLNSMAMLIEIARDDSTLNGTVALLCAACAAIAAGDEDELCMAVKPYMDRTTKEQFPDLWDLMQQMRRAENAPNN